MIRLILLSVFLVGLVVYAWKDWYKSLCGLIAMMAVMEHPDMPKSLLGIQGLNPWNITFAFIFFAWLSSRRRENLKWDMPRGISILLLLYMGVIVGASFRLITADGGLASVWDGGAELGMSASSVISEYVINSIKWVLPALLLYDGCRDRSRFLWALGSILFVYFLLAVQVIKWMPLSEVTNGEVLMRRGLKLVHNIGYHRVNLSMMLAGASWAVLASRVLSKSTAQWLLIVAVAMTIILGQALTGGRAGYATWAVVGLVLCVVRWRRMLLLVPVVVLAIVVAVPSVVERMTQGFSEDTRDYNTLVAPRDMFDDPDGPDAYTVTAGRNVAWRYVVPKILEAPVLGYGRLGMQTTGIMVYLWTRYRESFPHPHNAYLELLLDNGLVGFLIVMAFYLTVLKIGMGLFRSDESLYYTAIGGISLALVLALLVAAMGSQSFYPREGSMGMWCAIGLMLRVHTDRMRGLRRGPPAPDGETSPPDAPSAVGNPWLVGA